MKLIKWTTKNKRASEMIATSWGRNRDFFLHQQVLWRKLSQLEYKFESFCVVSFVSINILNDSETEDERKCKFTSFLYKRIIQTV